MRFSNVTMLRPLVLPRLAFWPRYSHQDPVCSFSRYDPVSRPPSTIPHCQSIARLSLFSMTNVLPARPSSVSPTCCSSRLTHPALLQSGHSALPASPLAASALDLPRPTSTPISEDNDFGDLLGRTTRTGNGKADLLVSLGIQNYVHSLFFV